MPPQFPKLRQPIVLIHGYGAIRNYGPFDYFYMLPKYLKSAGNRVLVADLAAWQGMELRSRQLKVQIESEFPGERVNLIGHSMGGLDARYLVSCLGFSGQTESVTTIGTPNHGTSLADLGVSLFPDGTFELLKQFQGWRQMSGRHGKDVLDSLVDASGVEYFSATTRIPTNFMKTSLPIFWIPYKVIQKIEGDNDGFVSVESAKWGAHICTWDGDHYAQIGQLLGRTRGLDYLAFWNEILSALKSAGH